MNHAPKISITVENVVAYLLEKRFLAREGAVEIAEVPGGVASTVIRIRTGERDVILKQALYKLKVKADWTVPLWRSHVEQDCIEFFCSFLPEGTVPKVLFKDRENYLFIMTAAPADFELWKTQLLRGTVNQTVAAKMGAIVAEIQNRTFDDDAVRARYDDNTIYTTGRIDPYYRVIQHVHPEVREAVDRLIERTLATRRALTTVDISPKNTLVKGDSIMLIDHEGAHFGDPSFDPAFLLNHLFLKSVRNSALRSEYFQAARNFWQAYLGAHHHVAGSEIEKDVVEHLGCLMLARVDGKSPAEYLREPEKALLREISKEIILGGCATLSGVESVVDAKLGAV